eukprot:102447-Amphidinium_carterae.1
MLGTVMSGWFSYLTDKSGEDEEDEIAESEVQQTRAELHKVPATPQASASSLLRGNWKVDAWVCLQVWGRATVEVIEAEAVLLKDHGGTKRVLLVGSSQGGSMALDAALTATGAIGAHEWARTRIIFQPRNLYKDSVPMCFDLRALRCNLKQLSNIPRWCATDAVNAPVSIHTSCSRAEAGEFKGTALHSSGQRERGPASRTHQILHPE